MEILDSFSALFPPQLALCPYVEDTEGIIYRCFLSDNIYFVDVKDN